MLPRQPIKLNNLDKILLKCGKLFNKHFCKKKNQISPMNKNIKMSSFKSSKKLKRKRKLQKLQISTFPIVSLWKLSYHSNQSSYLTRIKNITFVECNVLSKDAKFQLHPQRRFLNIFLKIYVLYRPVNQSNYYIISDLDKSRMKHRGLLNQHFCKKKIKYPY